MNMWGVDWQNRPELIIHFLNWFEVGFYVYSDCYIGVKRYILCYNKANKKYE